jgi:hypothetical protein
MFLPGIAETRDHPSILKTRTHGPSDTLNENGECQAQPLEWNSLEMPRSRPAAIPK